MTGKPLVVTCREVSRSYGRGTGAVHAVRDVSCDVGRAERIALVGESGSGKTTLLHLLGGLETVSSGTVSWPGLPMRGDRPAGVGVVFQAPSLLPALDVTDNVALPLLLAGAGAEELSGGQAQRVATARVLASRPALVLADEPTGQLDHRTAAHVLDVLLAAVSALGAALVVSTHDPEVAGRLDVEWAMADGQLRVPAIQGDPR